MPTDCIPPVSLLYMQRCEFHHGRLTNDSPLSIELHMTTMCVPHNDTGNNPCGATFAQNTTTTNVKLHVIPAQQPQTTKPKKTMS